MYILARFSGSSGTAYGQYHFNVEKRAAPTCSTSGSFVSSSGYSGTPSFTATLTDSTTFYAGSVAGGGILYLHDDSNALIKFDAEL